MINRTKRILESFKHKYRDSKFDWKNNNCVSWSSKVYKALNGVDFYEEYEVKNKKDFIMVLNRRKLSDLVAEKFGKPCKPCTARLGDIVIIEIDGDEIMGICFAPGQAYFLTEEGLTSKNLKMCKFAWSK